MIGDRVMMPLVRWRTSVERRLVEHPRRARQMALRGLAVFALVFASYIGVQFLSPGPLRALCGLIVGGWLGFQAFGTFGKAMAYRSGWLDGRAAMIATMSESIRRGLTMSDWLDSERERDMVVLGLQPRLRDEHEDDDDVP